MEAITRRQKKIKALVEMLNELQPYVGHSRSCKFSTALSSNPDSDFCICGLKHIVRKVNATLEKAKEE